MDVEPVERDSRGILDPWLLRQRIQLTRYPATKPLDGLIDRFWAVRWDFPPGIVHRQQVLTHPSANISVGHPNGSETESAEIGPIEARLNGVARRLTTRVLTGQGWTVAAMTTPGGLGAFVDGAAARFADRIVPLGEATRIDEAALLRDVEAQPDEGGRVAVLAAALERAIDPGKVADARRTADAARLAETDRSMRRLDELCARTGISQRTLQRMFAQHVGVSPTWVLRRYRLLEAGEAARGGEQVGWADVAAALGYADQAHLVRDFRHAFGTTPAAYAKTQPPD